MVTDEPFPQTKKGKNMNMKRTLVVAGGYLLAGALSCVAIASVASSMTDNMPPSEMVEKRSGDKAETATAAGETSAEEVKPKRRRTRRQSAKDGATTEKREKAGKRERTNASPRKPRARKSKKAAAPETETKQEGAAK